MINMLIWYWCFDQIIMVNIASPLVLPWAWTDWILKLWWSCLPTSQKPSQRTTPRACCNSCFRFLSFQRCFHLLKALMRSPMMTMKTARLRIDVSLNFKIPLRSWKRDNRYCFKSLTIIWTSKAKNIQGFPISTYVMSIARIIIVLVIKIKYIMMIFNITLGRVWWAIGWRASEVPLSTSSCSCRCSWSGIEACKESIESEGDIDDFDLISQPT